MSTPRIRAASWPLLSALLAVGCGGGSGGGSGPAAQVGLQQTKPDGSGLYFVDPHRGGNATRLHVAEMTWGRVVDVHDVDEQGRVNGEPRFRDFVIRETVQTDATGYVLETNPISEKTRLIVRRPMGAPDEGSGTFESLLADAARPLPAIQPKAADGSALPPFSMVPRNACIVVRFDDLLDDDEDAVAGLIESVRVTTGYPPEVPLAPRLLFDPNHGGVGAGGFHSTRVLIDVTVSEAEAVDMPVPQPINTLGLAASQEIRERPNVVVRFPTRTDFGSGQFALLRNLSGSALDTERNGPVEPTAPTQPIVRAMRSGNDRVTNNGFLLDFNAPRVLGAWPVAIDRAVADPLGQPGFDFLVDMTFGSVCREAPAKGDVLTVGGAFVEVSANAGRPGAEGVLKGVRVRVLSTRGVAGPAAILGQGVFRTTYSSGKLVPLGCWVTITPRPREFPSERISPSSRLTLRFTDPMDPASFKPFGSFMIVRGPDGAAISSRSLVVGEVSGSVDLKEFTFDPVLPFAHQQLVDPYTLRMVSREVSVGDDGITDLAGNVLADPLPAITFTIDPEEAPEQNGGLVLRYESADEIEGQFAPDFRGQVFLDPARGTLRPRDVLFSSVPVDDTVPVPSLMIPFPPGVQTPLSPLGSKMQALWRYVDVGWAIRDETRYDVDVVGLHWSPARGSLVSDFFSDFEIRLAHAKKVPDEQKRVFGTSKFPRSGLGGGTVPFADNILEDPRGPQKIVHPRSKGYRISSFDVFLGPTGKNLVPWPMNRGTGPLVSYTWRDTSVTARGGDFGTGVPLAVETGAPLQLESRAGSFARVGEVPSVGLPLLMEFRCYPTSSGVGLNSLAIALAINTSVRPNFRAFSTGGVNRAQQLVRKDPDQQVFPTGGFNPNSRPAGRRTRFVADNTLYIGQLDFVLRVSRGHSVWIDTLYDAPTYSSPVSDPEPGAQPSGTKIVFEYRGADAFSIYEGNDPFDARDIDAYGELEYATVTFHDDVSTWTDDIRDLDGARYFQVRYSFFSNIETGVLAELDSLAFAFGGE